MIIGLGRGRGGLGDGRGRFLAEVEVRQPLEPARQVPVPVSEQLHRGRQEHRPDDGGVEQDRNREPDAELLKNSIESVAKIANTKPSRSPRS